MAAARIKQLEDKIARYERVLSSCSRCKASLTSEEVEDATSPVVSPTQGGSSEQGGPKVPSTASAPSSKDPLTTGRQVQPIRSSKRNKPTSRSTLPQRNADAVDSPGSASRLAKTATGPSRDMERSSSRLSKRTTVGPVSSSSSSSAMQQTSTAHSLHLRPTSLRPSSSRIDTLSADTNQPSTTTPSLPKSRIGAGRPRNDPNKPGDWFISANIMLREVPLGWVWHAKIVQVDRSLLAAVATDTNAISDDTTGTVDDTQNKDRLVKLVRGFAHRHSVQRINFQQFLLVCLCKVLSAQKVPQSSIVEALKICISDTSEKNIDKYLKGAEWANTLMDRLFFTEWGYRAVDLLVLWDRSIAMYGRIASALDSTMDHFVSHLTQPEYYNDVEEISDRVHSTVPWIVKKEFGDEVSYETICKALGYSDEYISDTKHLHSSTRPSSDSDIQSSEDEDSASESQDFHSARQSADSRPSSHSDPPGLLPSGDIDGAAYTRAWSRLGKNALRRNDHDDSAHRDQAANQTAASQRPRRMMPDRSAQPLGDSRGSTPATQSSKRSLPDSPTSQTQSNDPPRRRQHEEEGPSREGTGSPSRPGNNDSYRRRDRA